MTTDESIALVAFDRCKEFPEVRKEGAYFMVKGDAYLALIELRNLAPEVVTALQSGCNKSAKPFAAR